MKREGNGSYLYILLAIALALFALGGVNAIVSSTSSLNQTALESEASLCINESADLMVLMQLDKFNVVRMNDTYKDAKALYDSQIILKSKNKPYDFSPVIKNCQDIKKMRTDAVDSSNELVTLLKYYNESIKSNMNSSSVDLIILNIQNEIRDERYENVPKLIEDAYSEIAAVQSSQTTLKIFSAATARGIKVFIVNNWKVLSTIIIVLAVLGILYRVQISISLLTRKIEKLKNRKKTIKDLVMQTQKDYFQYGKIPEGEYNVKTKKYAELMRDIDRQVPLLQEELAKLNSEN